MLGIFIWSFLHSDDTLTNTVRSGDREPYSVEAKCETEKFLDEVKPRNRDNCSNLENDIRFRHGMV
jgi:hypothetical protein